jgi:hypothetical protein
MGNYREFVRVPGVLPLLFVSAFGRLAYSMVSLAMFFQVLDVTGSVGTAGLAASRPSMSCVRAVRRWRRSVPCG